eukprot:TRINITY_DN15789_c0_g1_i1.p1 TRINITY_DN15789_c0_g1~~TRINITY_DN15789_c0_g1_i1.p1  ORF type:complete len:314 (+),score=33.22 TRINITY_DN15789_c0_g1_i1:60-944(+)
MSNTTSAPVPFAYVDASPPDELTCPVCLDPLVQPVTTPCEHTFCVGCVSPDQPCPLCRVHVPRAGLCPERSRIVSRMLDALRVYCPNRAEGCDWQGPRGDVASHHCGDLGTKAIRRECDRLQQRVAALESSLLSMSNVCMHLVQSDFFTNARSLYGGSGRNHAIVVGCPHYGTRDSGPRPPERIPTGKVVGLLHCPHSPILQPRCIQAPSNSSGGFSSLLLENGDTAYRAPFLCSQCIEEYDAASPTLRQSASTFLASKEKRHSARVLRFYCFECNDLMQLTRISPGVIPETLL